MIPPAALPSITAPRRWPAFLLGYSAFSAGYLLTGRLHWRPPAILPPSALDRAIPFLAWTLAVYASHYALPVLAFWRARDTAARTRLFYAMALASAFAFLAFAAFPTAVDRPEAAAVASPIFGAAWRSLYALDTPANCLPSLHAALALLSARALRDEGGAWRWSAAWAAAIAFSTLTTKQHLAADVAAGAALAFAAWTAAGRLRYSP